MESSTVAASVTVGIKRKHGQVAGPKEEFICDTCARIYTSKWNFTRHASSHSDQNAPPSSYEGWRQHYEYKHIFGLPDGRVWNCRLGRFLKGVTNRGYIRLRIDGKVLQRHRLNFEIAHGRAIFPDMEIDHITPSPVPNNGTERPPQDDSWANLQELTRLEHNIKTRADNPGAGKKRGVTQGFPVIARHVATGKETPFASINAAGLTLGLNTTMVWKCIKQGTGKEHGGHVFRRCPEHMVEQADRAGEVWKDAKLHGRSLRGIMVSSLGRVQLSNGRRTEGQLVQGRHKVNLRVDGKGVSVFVYNLMAHTFIGKPPTPEHTVDHIDGICDHDEISNLRYATKIEQGRNRTNNRAIRKYDLQGKLLQTYGTIAEAAEKHDLSRRQVGYAARNGSMSTGFRWEYVVVDTIG